MENKKTSAEQKRKKNKKFDSAKEEKVESTSTRVPAAGKYVNRSESNLGAVCNHPTAGNDPSWYSELPELVRDAASLAFAQPLGNKFQIANSDALTNGANYVLPGILQIRYLPSPGISTLQNAPVNVAAMDIYSWVRHMNSGHSNYDPVDLMLYLLAMDSVYSYWAFVRRIYGIAMVYSQSNRYWPEALLKMMGQDPQEIMHNLANLRTFLNAFAYKMSCFNTPSIFTYYKRHVWMNSGIWADDLTAKSQVYFYQPEGFYKYVETGTTGGSLTLIPYGDTSAHSGLQYLFDVGNQLMYALLRSEDCGIKSGDILKAYKDICPMNVFDSVNEDEVVIPTYDEEVLTQIENTMCYGALTNTDITQADGVLQFNPTRTNFNFGHNFMNILNVHSDEWKAPEYVLTATRNMPVVNRDITAESHALTFKSTGSEICTRYTIGQFNPSFTLETQNFSSFLDVDLDISPFSMWKLNDMMSAFERHPKLVMMKNNTSTSKYGYESILWQWSDYTILHDVTLGNMHEVALMSQFALNAISVRGISRKDLKE